MEKMAGAIMVERDEDSGDFFVVWSPVVAAGLGATERAALEDLRRAAHYAVDCCIDAKLTEYGDRNP
jgi:hypothetical protein